MKVCNMFSHLPNVVGATAFFVLTYSKQHTVTAYSVTYNYYGTSITHTSDTWLLHNNYMQLCTFHANTHSEPCSARIAILKIQCSN